MVKALNIMDPLLPTNNLGRSVSRANFLRMRRAFAHGAKALEAIICMVCVCTGVCAVHTSEWCTYVHVCVRVYVCVSVCVFVRAQALANSRDMP